MIVLPGKMQAEPA